MDSIARWCECDTKLYVAHVVVDNAEDSINIKNTAKKILFIACFGIKMKLCTVFVLIYRDEPHCLS